MVSYFQKLSQMPGTIRGNKLLSRPSYKKSAGLSLSRFVAKSLELVLSSGKRSQNSFRDRESARGVACTVCLPSCIQGTRTLC